jgi:hypothetical protein
MQDLHRGGDNVVIKMDDLTQNIFYQPELKKNVHEILGLSFTMPRSHVKGGQQALRIL